LQTHNFFLKILTVINDCLNLLNWHTAQLLAMTLD